VPDLSATTARPFGRAYATAFAAYLAEPDERALRTAYELGRDALLKELSLLELATAHHEALLAETRHALDREEADRITRLAADFFAESLSAYEMARLGFEEVADTAAAERRQAALVRSLSSLLTDTSLALHGRESLEEMLRLVAEQACELSGAECCIVTTHAEGDQPAMAVVAYAGEDSERARALESHGLSTTHDLIRAAGDAARLTAEEVATTAAFESLPGERPAGGWLGVRLTALDGTELGFVQLLGETGRPFSQLDAALVVQLGQMTSAALERATHYTG
jgi:phosphoserine phosphatase RsbU-like protein/GAF domain-containing protein